MWDEESPFEAGVDEEAESNALRRFGTSVADRHSLSKGYSSPIPLPFETYESPFLHPTQAPSGTDTDHPADPFEAQITSRKKAYRPAYFYDHNGKYLGVWKQWHTGWQLRLIARSDYQRILLALPGAQPSQFRTKGVRRMVRSLVRGSRPLRVQRLKTQKKFLNNLFAKAKKGNKEFAAYILLNYLKATLAFQSAIVTNQTARSVEIKLGIVPGTDTRTLPRPHGDTAIQVIGTVHTHYLRDPWLNTSSTNQGTTIGGSRIRLFHGVSKDDRESATAHGIVVHALDSRYIHKALPSKKPLNKRKKDQNVLVNALWLFGSAPGPSP